MSLSTEKNDRRSIFGWMVYDWANSAFFTTVVSVLIGPYLMSLAEKSVGAEGLIVDLYITRITPKNLYGLCIAISVLSMVIVLPVLGAIADYTHLKKRLMAVFCYIGVLAGSLLFFVTDSYVVCSLLLIISNMSFAAANVFYNAFLIDLTTEDKRDRVSSNGYASGYIGGVVMLLINLLLINNAERLGITTGMAVRISFLLASLWWGLFAVVTFYLVRTTAVPKPVPEGKRLVSVGFSELWRTLVELRRLKFTALFLVAYLFYNDGIQTVILQASVFLSYELFTSKGIPEDSGFLLGIFLVAQISALVGALLFERIARRIGAKRAILLSLSIWCGIVIYAYGFLSNTFQAWIMAVFIGMVLGSSQALSRSLYSQMIPPGRESSFFGLYEISEKGTSWMGQLLFVVIVGATGSYRNAILGLIVFFVVGSVILLFTDTRRAIHEAGNLTPEEAERSVDLRTEPSSI
jgi:MFS transporter, UMF1 family